ncbi:MAG: hypothetical protein Q9175_005438, partial [Cornicularia normoerica]
MQHRERVISTHGLEDPTTLQIIADDADWLEKITLDSIDYNDTSPKFPLEFPPNTEPEDEDAALTAHLWDRDHASDLSAYEWNSDDLVSEVHSGEGNTPSDEELPRLARKDEFEQGIRREGTWTREYRERWEEHHVFYKRKIEMRLEAVGDGGEDYEGHSYFSEGAWSSQVGDDWGTPATSGGAEWTTRFEEPWTAGDGWVEWKKEDSEPFMGPESPLLQERDGIDQEQGSGEMDDKS